MAGKATAAAKVKPAADVRLAHRGGTGARIVAELLDAKGETFEVINLEDGGVEVVEFVETNKPMPYVELGERLRGAVRRPRSRSSLPRRIECRKAR